MQKSKFVLVVFLLIIGLMTAQSLSVVLANNDYGSGGGNDYGSDGGNDYGSGGGNDYTSPGDGGNDYGGDTPIPTPDPTPTPVPTPTPTPTPAPTRTIFSDSPSRSLVGYLPAVDIKADSLDGPISIPAGTSAYLYWSASNVFSCSASNGWSGSRSDFGSEKTEVLNSSKTYTITCSGQGGSASDSVTVNVKSSFSQLSVQKSVRDINQNTPYQDMVYAFPGDDLSFKIDIEMLDDKEALNVSVKDILPAEIVYQGNLRINDQTVSYDISNIPLGIFVKKQTKTITFDAKVSPKNNFNYGLTALVNQVGVKADNVAEVFDSATINVNTLSGEVGLSIFKMAKNLTKGDTEWKNEITSAPGDTLQFQIKVTNTKTSVISGFKIKDILHSKLIYSGNLFIDDATTRQDIKEGVDLGAISGGQTKIITFEAKVADENNFSYGATELINVADTFNDNFSLFATTKVLVSRKGVLGATDVVTGTNMFYIALMAAFAMAIFMYFLFFYLNNSQRSSVRRLVGFLGQVRLFIFR